MRLRLIGTAVLVCALALASSAAEARKARNHAPQESQDGAGCVYGNTAVIVCPSGGDRVSGAVKGAARHVRRVISDVIHVIPHPAGCPRVAFCACGLAKYWRLGPGLNLVATWPKVFPRARGPGIGIAAVRSDKHHVLGIIGGGPGAWEVVDYNSGGHRSHRYVVADFPGYFFVDPRARTASR